LKDLSTEADHAKEEAQREKAMRLALEEAQTKLEDHKKVLMSQMETTKASQAGMEDKIVQFREDLDLQNVEFDKERTKWEELVKQGHAVPRRLVQKGDWPFGGSSLDFPARGEGCTVSSR